MAIETKEELIVDRSAHGDLLRINFNISFPSLSCEFATLDVSDALGTVSGKFTSKNSNNNLLLAEIWKQAFLGSSVSLCLSLPQYQIPEQD